MQLEQLELTGGGTLTLYLRESVEAMPHFRQRPLVLVVPGGGYTHVSPGRATPWRCNLRRPGITRRCCTTQ